MEWLSWFSDGSVICSGYMVFRPQGGCSSWPSSVWLGLSFVSRKKQLFDWTGVQGYSFLSLISEPQLIVSANGHRLYGRDCMSPFTLHEETKATSVVPRIIIGGKAKPS